LEIRPQARIATEWPVRGLEPDHPPSHSHAQGKKCQRALQAQPRGCVHVNTSLDRARWLQAKYPPYHVGCQLELQELGDARVHIPAPSYGAHNGCKRVIHKQDIRSILWQHRAVPRSSRIGIRTGWMDGWMDGWLDGWMVGWMDTTVPPNHLPKYLPGQLLAGLKTAQYYDNPGPIRKRTGWTAHLGNVGATVHCETDVSCHQCGRVIGAIACVRQASNWLQSISVYVSLLRQPLFIRQKPSKGTSTGQGQPCVNLMSNAPTP
jgi:hypothetical protein